MGSLRTRTCRALAITTIALGATVVASAPASAVTIAPVCDAYLSDANGNPTGGALATDNALPGIELPSLGSGATVEVDTGFDVVGGGTTVALPASTQIDLDGPGGNPPTTITILEIKNIKITFQSNGGATIGTPILSGGTVLGASATVDGNKITLLMPGSQNGSSIPGGAAFFPPGNSFTVPTLTIPVTAPSTPGTISTSVVGFSLMVEVSLLPNQGILQTKLPANSCDVPANVVGSVEVVNPPPPPENAPTADNDTTSTGPGTAVVVDVLANDTPDDEFPIDTASLKVIEPPSHGAATVNADGTVTYTPDAGFLGTDNFRYELCSDPGESEVDPETLCDTALVSVTVTDDTPVTTTTVAPLGTTVPPTAAPVTAAAGGSTLPVTGDSSAPIAIVGLAFVALGGAASLVLRRRTT